MVGDGGADRRILVVDDDGEICELVREALVARGCEPTCALSDREAYDLLRRGPAFAALIIDINLGAGTTGYDVARFARQGAPKLAVLYISGQSKEASFLNFGVPGSMFLAKPFLPGTLAVQLEVLLELSRG